jgi:enoyl-CoA hydratase/carnithine racemase
MPVITTRHGAVTEVCLDWPDVRNAMGPDEGRELRLAIEQATMDQQAGAVVLSATGPAFCAGGNLRAIVRLAQGGPQAVRDTIYAEFQGLFRALRDSPVPLLSAVDGPAVGFGCDLALACSSTFIGGKGWIAQGWARAGLIPATGGAYYACRRAGEQSMWRLMAASKVDGPTAEAWGLAIACDEARAAALEMATRLADLPPGPVRTVKKLIRLDDLDRHLDAALEAQVGFLTHPDFPAFAQRLLSR